MARGVDRESFVNYSPGSRMLALGVDEFSENISAVFWKCELDIVRFNIWTPGSALIDQATFSA